MTLVRRVLLIAFFFEIGLLLIVMPWSAMWDRNYFIQTLPWIGGVIRNNFVRGAVSGLGLVNCYVGLLESVAIVFRWRASRSATADGGVA